VPLQVTCSVVSGDAIARAVEAEYPLGSIEACYLLQSGYNDVYELQCTSGTKYVARLSAHRFRGPANIAYEVAFLAHLRDSGLRVACAVAGTDGRLWRELDAPEGPRTFAVFDHLEGRTAPTWNPKLDEGVIDDVRLLGAEFARLHTAGETYSGPPSLYQLEGAHLLAGPISQLVAAPTLDDAPRLAFSEIGSTLGGRVAKASPGLSRVACHGDNHGGNTVMSGARGERVAAWFDFDDCGPGFLAYDLAVFLWQLLLSARRPASLNANGQTLWEAFLGGYRTNRVIPLADFDAIALFVPIRHILWLSERAGRVGQWGTKALSEEWLRPQMATMQSWDGMVTPSA
jgi:Ser/Thr protein kinase RdoA (MazF antagonist)